MPNFWPSSAFVLDTHSDFTAQMAATLAWHVYPRSCLALRDVRWWLGPEGLSMDDFTFWNFLRRREHARPGQMEISMLNPHAFCV